MKAVLLANIIGLMGATVMVLTGFLKKKPQILGAQIIQFVLMATSNFCIGGYAAVVTNSISIFRNIYFFKWGFNIYSRIFFIAVYTILSLSVNSLGWLGFIPLITTVAFTLTMDTKNVRLLKTVIIVTCAMWALYDFMMMNYTTCAFDLATCLSNIIGIFMLNNDKKKQETN